MPFPLSTYAARRDRFLEKMQPGIALFRSAPATLRNGSDVHHEYRQDSDLLWLTGFCEPDAVLVLVKSDAGPKSVLFLRPKDRELEIWSGRRVGVEAAPECLGVDAAHPIAKFDGELAKLLIDRQRVYARLGDDPAFDQRLFETLRALRLRSRANVSAPAAIENPASILDDLRLFKSDEEIALLRKAGNVTAIAHRRAMIAATAGRGEADIQALVEYTFRQHGGKPGYGTIAGAGDNATILHYVDNAAPIQDGDLMLLDAGCELDGYTADVTRAFPASGRFTKPQAAIYEIVLDAQRAAIGATKPGAAFDAPHRAALEVLVAGMVTLGLVEGDPRLVIEDEKIYKPFYPHRTSHWLGLDVHDVGSYSANKAPRVLAPGMVLTIEPGLYVGADLAESMPKIPREYLGIGVRIEDDILVTAEGCEILTAGIPRTIAEIERTIAEGRARGEHLQISLWKETV